MVQEQEREQVVQAILIASDPLRANLHQEALNFLSNIQENAEKMWQLALELFVSVTPENSRKYSSQVRFFALRVLDAFLENRSDPLDEQSFQVLQQSFMSYIQTEYVDRTAEASESFLRNKFSHTLTLLFLSTYTEQWPTFFVDLFTLIRSSESSSSQPRFNRHVSLLFFHLVSEISGEVADQMIKSARIFNADRHARDARVRDAVRDRDAGSINEAVLTIVSDCASRMTVLRKEDEAINRGALNDEVEVVDWGMRTFGSYVGWVDINLTVTAYTVPLLFSLLSDPSLPIRLATSLALLRIVAKGLKEPVDKLQLIKVLSLSDVIDALENRTRAEQLERGKETDEGEESYREALGKLLNILGQELTKLVEDEGINNSVQAESQKILDATLPVALRFMADEYDDTCSTVFPFISGVLAIYKRIRKISTEPLDVPKRDFLLSLLQVILQKMTWDEETDPEDLDDDDKADFEVLRKELRSFMDSALFIDQDLVTNAVQTLAFERLSAYQAGNPLKWHEAELAVYLVYIYGEINKSGGKGRAAFCLAPPIDKEKRKATDYSEFPLTTHGQMLAALVQCGISSYPHPTVAMQFFETVSRYGDFFKVRREFIMPTLQAMMDPRGIHNPNPAVRSRVFYLFHRFIKECRNEMNMELAIDLIDGIRDLLLIQVDLPELENPEDQDLLSEAISNPGIFDSQLYLFETAGILLSSLFKETGRQTSLLLSIVKPLMDNLSENLQSVKSSQDVIPIVKVHHTIMALGNLAKGFPDYPSPVPDGYVLPPLDVFGQVSQAILVCLDAMKVFKGVRDATRFAFARILATMGPHVTHFIPTLMENLLAHFEPSELVDFMNFLSLLIHKLQGDMFQVLDKLIGPLSEHITSLLSRPTSGTDDTLTRAETKKAYLALLNNVMTSKLHGIFLSDQNKARFEPLLGNMLSLAENVADPPSQKAALLFLGKGVSVWGQLAPDNTALPQDALPGFERFIYERLVPGAFGVLPQLNFKDGQSLGVLNEVANFLQTVTRTRGIEAYNFLVSTFLPSQNWPAEMAVDFTTKMRDLDAKSFRKYFTDLIRTSRSS